MIELVRDLLYVGLWVIALASLTRLVTTDVITDPIRIWIYNRFHYDSMIGELVGCPWCMSMWLSFGSVWVVFLQTDLPWWLYPELALAGRYLVGLSASNLEPDDDSEVEIVNG